MIDSHIRFTKKRVILYTRLLSKLQRNVEITALFYMHVIRDRTDHLVFIERNEQCRNYFNQL